MEACRSFNVCNQQDVGERRFSARTALTAFLCVGLCACGGNGSPAAPPPQALLQCDQTLKIRFIPDPNTKVVAVKAFKAGDPITLADTPDASHPVIAEKDMCLVKLLVGPGNPGTPGLPSTSEGIGMEIWLPARGDWNHRIRNLGGDGWAGGQHASPATVANPALARIASQGWVTGHTDAGHQSPDIHSDGAFAMKEDGAVNTALWNDFAYRSVKELALKTRALTLAYYGRLPEYAYWDGCATGGRQGYKIAQEDPELYDGYLIGAPVVNWTRFLTNLLYPQTVMYRDLGDVMDAAKITLTTRAAIDSCNKVNGQKLPFILNPAQCRYDPTKDPAVLCAGVKGNDGVAGASTARACVNLAEAIALNKIWYGQTADGSVPDPALDNAGQAMSGSPIHLWWGIARGTDLARVAGTEPFSMATEMVAMELQDPSIATPAFKNPAGNGKDGYKDLSYADLALAYARGVQLQDELGHVNTDNPDLNRLRTAGGKIITYHGWQDEVIPPMGTINYYSRAASSVGGYRKLAEFNRLYMVPAYGHCRGVGSLAPASGPALDANSVPLPGPDQFFTALVDWTEKGVAPASIVLKSADGSASLPVCPYPEQAVYKGAGPANAASSYTCREQGR